MVTSSSGLSIARFDRYSVDLSTGVLLRSGARIPIQGQPLQVLRLLLEADGRVVTREALRRALWPEDTFVDFELGVNTAVKKLRQALEDSAEHPRFIETLPKVGYRFVVPVEWTTQGSDRNDLPHLPAIPVPAPPEPPKRRWELKTAVVVIALAVMAAFVSLLDSNSRLAQTQFGSVVRRALTHQPPQVLERQLTANPEGMPVTGAVISPDGKYLAFTDSTGFYLRQVDGGEMHPVPLPKGFSPIPQSWLSDSLHLIVMWIESPAAAPTLWEISVLGGTPKKVTDEGAAARVSPDGSKIAFLRGRYTNQEIWLMKSDGTDARMIVDGGRGVLGPVAWAPDGTRLAYFRANPSGGTATSWNEQIEVYDIGNGHTDVILQDNELLQEIAWLNDRRLIYSSVDPSPGQAIFSMWQGSFSLWSVKLDSQTSHFAGSSTKIYSGPRAAGDRITLSVTGDSKRMALYRMSAQADVYIADLDKQSKKLKQMRRLTFDERNDSPFSWTPDSKAVFFVSNRDGPAHIFRQNINEKQPELVIGGSEDLFEPRVSPDGSALVYTVIPATADPHPKGRIWRVPITGGSPTLVLEDKPTLWNLECARLPSTVCIYGIGDGNQERFFTFDPREGKGVELWEARIPLDRFTNPSWGLSPDGNYLATVKNGGDKDHSIIRIFSLSDNTIHYAALPGWHDTEGLDWAADSKSIWIGANRLWSGWAGCTKDHWTLLDVDLNGNVTIMLEDDAFTGNAIPSPDGRHGAIFGDTRRGNVWLLENF